MWIDLQQLLYDGLVATGNVDCSAIISKKDSIVRATSAGYRVSLLVI